MSANKYLQQITGAFRQIAYSDVSGTPSIPSTSIGINITNATTANIGISNATFTAGPSVAQGTVGIWFATGTVTLVDTAAPQDFSAILWDGTTIIDSAYTGSAGAGYFITVTLSGVASGPAGNLRIGVKTTAATTATSFFGFNNSGESKDSSLTAVRIG